MKDLKTSTGAAPSGTADSSTDHPSSSTPSASKEAYISNQAFVLPDIGKVRSDSPSPSLGNRRESPLPRRSPTPSSRRSSPLKDATIPEDLSHKSPSFIASIKKPRLDASGLPIEEIDTEEASKHTFYSIPKRLYVPILLFIFLMLIYYVYKVSTKPTVQREINAALALLNDCFYPVDKIPISNFSSEALKEIRKSYKKYLRVDKNVVRVASPHPSFVCRIWKFLDSHQSLSSLFLLWFLCLFWYLLNIACKQRASRMIPMILKHMKSHSGRIYLEDAKRLVSDRSFFGRFYWHHLSSLLEEQFSVQKVSVVESKPFWALGTM